MSEPSIFENEQLVITETETYLSQADPSTAETLPRLHKLLKSYKKFLRHFTRVVKINDRQQTQLRKQEEELRAEIDKRKEIEFRLRENEKQLVQARDLAEKALEDRAQFFASMSHEIRTPLNGVIGSANLLQASPLTQAQTEFTNIIVASSKILLVVINDILDFSKIESGNLQLESQSIHLESIIEESLNITGISAFSKGVEVLFTCPIPNFHQISFLGDSTRISQVIINLLSNAIKFTSQGTVVLKVEITQDEVGNSFLLFSVQDTGIGIAPNKIKSLFHAFAQAEASTTREYGGTGLGLTICHHLTSQWGGKIWVESQEGEGSTFSFTIPYQPIESAEDYEKTYYPNLEAKHLLVLDPNQQALHQMQRILDLQQINYTLVNNLQDALKSVQGTSKFDLLIINHAFPQLSATQILQQINLASKEPIPSLILAPPGVTLDENQAGDMPTASLSKPFKRTELFKNLDAILNKSASSAIHLAVSQTKAPPNLALRYPMQILIAEDNQINQAIATATFKQLGYQTHIVANGKEALDQAIEFKFDLIFMDVQMPVMDGLEATQQINKALKASSPPIIAITANASIGDRQTCLHSGMSDFLSKPLMADDLIQIIIKWAEKLDIQPVEGKDPEEVTFSKDQTQQPVSQSITTHSELFNIEMFNTLKSNYSCDLLLEITTHYTAELALSIELMETHLALQEWEEMKKAAHKIRGSSLNLGVDSIAELYSRIEAATRTKNKDEVAIIIIEIKKIEDQVCVGIQQLTQ